MPQPNAIKLIYGYIVCLIAVIVFIIALGSLVVSISDYNNPEYEGWHSTYGLASFDIYKINVLKASPEGNVPEESTLRAMYDAAKSEHVDTGQYRALRSIFINAILIVLVVVIYIPHWRWLEKLIKVHKGESEAAAASA